MYDDIDIFVTHSESNFGLYKVKADFFLHFLFIKMIHKKEIQGMKEHL